MRNVTIKSLKLEGFGSYANPVTFKFDKTGLFCITGVNGAGKSTIFSALYWALYKKTLSGWTNDKLQTFKWLRGKEYQGTRVMVSFNAGGNKYVVVRHLNFKGLTYGVEGGDSFMIFCKPLTDKAPISKDDMVGSELYKNDQQAYLNKVLGIDHNTFINSVVFGQKMNRLIGASPTEKRELFEVLFGIDFIDAAKEKADLRKSELEKQIESATTQVDTINNTLTNKRAEWERLQGIQERYETDKKERLAAIKKEYDLSKEKYNSLGEKLYELEQAQAKKSNKKNGVIYDVAALRTLAEGEQEKLEEAKEKVRKQKINIRDIDSLIQGFENKNVRLASDLRSVKANCTTCGAPLKPENVAKVKKNIQAEIEANDKSILDNQFQREKVVKALAQYEVGVQVSTTAFDDAYNAWQEAKEHEKASVDTLQIDIDKITTQMEHIKEGLIRIKERHKAEKEKPLPELNMDKLEESINSLSAEVKSQLESIQPFKDDLERVNWWIKKGFGANGIKAQIISAMFHKLNEFAANYSPYFGYGVKFWIDLSKASKPFMTTIYRGEKEIPYENMSGGQKQRVDVCLAFAMYDLVSYDTKFNLMVLDEFSEGLDGEGVEMVNEVITKAAETKAVYIVSHNPIFVPPSATTIIIEGGVDSPSQITL